MIETTYQDDYIYKFDRELFYQDVCKKDNNDVPY